MSIAYYNGDFSEFSDIRIPLTDRSVFFGDGIYDAAIGMNGKIYLEEEHINRFFKNASIMNIPVGFSKIELSSLLHELISKSGIDEYFIYFHLTRFSAARCHAYPDGASSNLLITIKEHTVPSPAKLLKLITADDVRYSMCNVKTLNLLPNVIASARAERAGCDEAVFVRNGIVTECAHSNIFAVKDGIVYTHPNSNFILPGITRGRILFLCEKLDIPYKELPFSKEDLSSADDILVTSTTKLCLRATELDGKRVGMKKSTVSERLISAVNEDFYSIFLQKN